MGNSINMLAEMIMDLFDKYFEPIYEESRIGDIRDSYADISKAKTELDYKPVYSLELGLKSLIENLRE